MDVRLYRLFLKALLFCVAIHVLALLTTALILMPGLDMTSDTLARAAWVAAHPWLWRGGWFLWALSALGNVLMSVALCAALASAPGKPGLAIAVSAAAFAAVGVVPDMFGNLGMVFDLVERAAEQPLDPVAYIAAESTHLWRVGSLAALLYTLMGIGWLFAVVRACGGVWRHRVLVTFGLLSATIFVFSAIANGRAIVAAGEVGIYEGYEVGAAANALAFPLWLLTALWIGSILCEAHHDWRPNPDRESRALRWPHPGLIERLMTRAANARGPRDLIRAGLGRIALVPLRSDVTDVVYLNWSVPTHRLAAHLPEALDLDEHEGRSIITALVYRHGHFGPALLGPIRRLLAPSPLQSNWRVYLAPERPGAQRDAVYFLTCCTNMPTMVPTARLFSDSLPFHFARAFTHERQGSVWISAIDPEGGSAPDLRSEVIADDARTLPAGFDERFDDWRAAVRHLVTQSRVLSVHPAFESLHEANMHIPFNLDTVIPARVVGRVESRWLDDIVRGTTPLTFVVPSVQFTVLSEGWIDGYRHTPVARP